MKIALIGGTGFVGSYLTDALVDAGMRPKLLVRPASKHRVRHKEKCEMVIGDLDDPKAILQTVEETDAVIYNVGILREYPSRNITFEALQHQGALDTMQAARDAGVKRFLLMSANGVDRQTTSYQQNKFQAESALQSSGLDWTIFRPSVIFGDPRGRMEFASQLARDVIAPPFPAPLFYEGIFPVDAGGFRLSPVHIADVAEAFVQTLKKPDTINKILPLGGPNALSWRAILQAIASAMGKSKTMVPVPVKGVALTASLLERYEQFPITRDQIRMLLQGNTCPPDALQQLVGEPRPFDTENLHYLHENTGRTAPWSRNAA